jgi:16S rRNA (cytidine1402-2'-O)-methyltransferase
MSRIRTRIVINKKENLDFDNLWLNYIMLYLVATPIGNLGDISLRALDTLRSADLVVSEDTRKTGIMLKHFEISKPQISFFEGNESKHLPKVMAAFDEGKQVALVSNAGTPGVSDPGFTLVRAALDAGIEVSAVPGPTALVMALVLSGLPVHSFTFRGFPPRKPGPRKRFMEVDKESPHTLIFYESPHRLLAFLKDALEVYGDRPAAIANDLTKKFESVDRGALSILIDQFSMEKLLGEYTIVIHGK